MKFWLIPLLTLLLLSCGRAPGKLDTFGTVPDFKLTAETGNEFDSTNLAGKVWVASFIFTTCSGPCPRMTAQMRLVQDAIQDLPEVRLVSFTVDPERDTPEALAEYARRYKAEPNRWYFLTGPQETLHNLNRNAFKLGNVDGNLDHSTRFVLVDKRSQIRGYYMTTDADAIPRVIADIRTLAKDPV